MLSSNTQGWRKQVGRVGICPPRFWQNRRCSGDVPNYYLAYTRHVEFISVYCMENYQSWGSSADLSHAKVDKKVKKITHFQKYQGNGKDSIFQATLLLFCFFMYSLIFKCRSNGLLIFLIHIRIFSELLKPWTTTLHCKYDGC